MTDQGFLLSRALIKRQLAVWSHCTIIFTATYRSIQMYTLEYNIYIGMPCCCGYDAKVLELYALICTVAKRQLQYPPVTSAGYEHMQSQYAMHMKRKHSRMQKLLPLLHR